MEEAADVFHEETLLSPSKPSGETQEKDKSKNCSKCGTRHLAPFGARCKVFVESQPAVGTEAAMADLGGDFENLSAEEKIEKMEQLFKEEEDKKEKLLSLIHI